jgi:hypothetical protein
MRPERKNQCILMLKRNFMYTQRKVMIFPQKGDEKTSVPVNIWDDTTEKEPRKLDRCNVNKYRAFR